MMTEMGLSTETRPMFDAPAPANTLAQGVSTREAQIIQGAIISAKMYPRDRRQAFDKIIKDCQRPSMAEVAMYSYPKGGQTVSGSSIRMAEMLAANWGNMRAGFQEQKHNGYSDVIAYCWDLETNTFKNIDFTVRHWRDTKKGGYAITDERDIYELVANQAQRRVRACILALIPGDVKEAAEAECEKTMTSKGDLQTKQAAIVKSFGELGVKPEQIEKRLGKKIQAISHVDATQMQKIYRSLKDGMSEVDDWFEQIAEPEKRNREERAAAEQPNAGGMDVPDAKRIDELEKAKAEFKIACDESLRVGIDPARNLPKLMADILTMRPADIRAAAKLVRDGMAKK